VVRRALADPSAASKIFITTPLFKGSNLCITIPRVLFFCKGALFKNNSASHCQGNPRFEGEPNGGSGIAAVDCEKINGELVITKSPIGADEKEKFIESLGAEYVVAVGNGTNDNKMLLNAGLGIGVIGHEGAFHEIITSCGYRCP